MLKRTLVISYVYKDATYFCTPTLSSLEWSGHLHADIDHNYRLPAVIDSMVSYYAQHGSHRILVGFAFLSFASGSTIIGSKYSLAPLAAIGTRNINISFCRIYRITDKETQVIMAGSTHIHSYTHAYMHTFMHMQTICMHMF